MSDRTGEPKLKYRHKRKQVWDSGNPDAVDGYVSWCEGCGQRPWPCDTVVVFALPSPTPESAPGSGGAESATSARAARPPGERLNVVCRVCGDAEPVHVHNGDERIEDYFTVGRGETDFMAAQRWKARALAAEGRLAELGIGKP